MLMEMYNVKKRGNCLKNIFMRMDYVEKHHQASSDSKIVKRED